MTAEELEEHKEMEINKFVQAAMELDKERRSWVQNSPRSIRPLVQLIHGLLFRYALSRLKNLGHNSLLWNLGNGFPLVGALTEIDYGCSNKPYNPNSVKVEDVVGRRTEANTYLSG